MSEYTEVQQPFLRQREDLRGRQLRQPKHPLPEAVSSTTRQAEEPED